MDTKSSDGEREKGEESMEKREETLQCEGDAAVCFCFYMKGKSEIRVYYLT
jgi:hypothetical protein